jgi:long-chain fatty acid transport protein
MTRIICISLPHIVIFLMLAIPSFASRLNQEDGIMPNHSADYVRTLNRNASTSADAAFYNPAGLAYLEYKGLSVHFSSQTYYAKRIHTMDYYGIKFQNMPMIPTSNYLNPINGKPKEYFAETLAPVLPGFDLVWKDDAWAVYLDVAVTQAAPGMTFNQGLAVIDWGLLAPFETTYASTGGVSNKIMGMWRDSKAVRTEYYISGTVGGAYRIREWVSTALGIRYLYASGNQNITVKYAGIATQTASGFDVNATRPWLIDTDVKGHGCGIIAGFHFRPVGILDIGLKYEYYPPMVLKKKTNKFFAPGVVASSGNLNIFLDGIKPLILEELYDPAGFDIKKMTPQNLVKFRKEVKPELKVTYPQSIALGASVKIWKGIRAEVSGEIQLRHLRDLDGREDDFKDIGYRVGGCLEWNFLPKATVSAGYVFNDFGVKPNARNEVDPLLKSHSIGGGFMFNVTDWLDVTVGGMYMLYQKEKVYSIDYTNVTGPTFHAIGKEFDEKRMSIAIGFTVKLFGAAPEKKEDDGMSIKLIKDGT